MQLSRKGWNNVIIFSMLIMILLFKWLHKDIGGSNNEPVLQPVLPIQSFVLTLRSLLIKKLNV